MVVGGWIADDMANNVFVFFFILRLTTPNVHPTPKTASF